MPFKSLLMIASSEDSMIAASLSVGSSGPMVIVMNVVPSTLEEQAATDARLRRGTPLGEL